MEKLSYGSVSTASRNTQVESEAERKARLKKHYHHNRGKELKEFMFKFLSLSKCVDCGERRVLCLEFDHKNSQKKLFNLGKAPMIKGLSLKELVREIAKCEVRCANCHTIKTHQEQNTWRYQKNIEAYAKEDTA